MINHIFALLGASENLRLMGFAAALAVMVGFWWAERGGLRRTAVALSVVVPVGIGGAALLLLCVGELRYAAHAAPLDLVEAHYAATAWEARSGHSVFDHDPTTRIVALMYGPLTYAVYGWVLSLGEPTMQSLKLLAGTCSFAGILLATLAAARLSGKVVGVVVGGLLMAAIASGGTFFLLARADPMILFLTGLATFLASATANRWSQFGAFAACGVLALVKPHLALSLWAILLLVTIPAQVDIRRLALPVTAALVGAGVAVLLDRTESIRLAKMLVEVAGGVPVRPDLLSENLLLAGIPVAFCALLDARRRRSANGPALLSLGTLLGCVAVLMVGSVDGTGDNHALLVLVPCIVWGAALWGHSEARSRTVIRRGAAALAVSFLPALLARTPSLLWQTRGDAEGSSVWVTEGQSMIRRFRGSVAVGFGDNAHASYEAMLHAPYLVFAGAEQRMEPMALMIWRKLGGSSSALRPLITRSDQDAWILPTHTVPLTLDNWFGGEGALLGPLERRAFAATFRPWCRGSRYTLWLRSDAVTRHPAQECSASIITDASPTGNARPDRR